MGRDINVHTYIYEKYSCSLFQYVYKPVRIDSFAFCCHNWSYDTPRFGIIQPTGFAVPVIKHGRWEIP